MDDGIKPTNRNKDQYDSAYAFGIACTEHGIEQTRVNRPWTNGQVERMNRTIKKAPVKRYHCASHDQLRRKPADFVAAYNFARRLKTLRGLTSYQRIGKCWTKEPDRFKINPRHHMPGPNSE